VQTTPGGSQHVMRTRGDDVREGQGEPTRPVLRVDEENMPPPVDIEHPRKGRRASQLQQEQQAQQSTDEDVYENAHSTQVTVDVHQEDEDDAEEPTYDNQEAIEEANKDESSSVHDDAFATSPPAPPVGPRVPRPGRSDPAEEERRRQEAARMEAEARAAREAAHKKADEDARAAREAARRKAEERAAKEKAANNKKLRQKLREIGASVAEQDAIIRALCTIRTPNVRS